MSRDYLDPPDEERALAAGIVGTYPRSNSRALPGPDYFLIAAAPALPAAAGCAGAPDVDAAWPLGFAWAPTVLDSPHASAEAAPKMTIGRRAKNAFVKRFMTVTPR